MTWTGKTGMDGDDRFADGNSFSTKKRLPPGTNAYFNLCSTQRFPNRDIVTGLKPSLLCLEGRLSHGDSDRSYR
jgi:hypothetical protein